MSLNSIAGRIRCLFYAFGVVHQRGSNAGQRLHSHNSLRRLNGKSVGSKQTCWTERKREREWTDRLPFQQVDCLHNWFFVGSCLNLDLYWQQFLFSSISTWNNVCINFLCFRQSFNYNCAFGIINRFMLRFTANKPTKIWTCQLCLFSNLLHFRPEWINIQTNVQKCTYVYVWMVMCGK